METSTPTASPDERHESFSCVQCQADDRSAGMNRTKSPLLRLPGELRNKIYQYALSDRTLAYKKCSPVNVATANMDGTIHIYHLSLTCRQIYEETREIAYCLATFRIDCPELYSHLVSGRDKNDSTKIEISPLHMFMAVFRGSKIHYSLPSRSDERAVPVAWRNMFKDFARVPLMTILFAKRETDREYDLFPGKTVKEWCHILVTMLFDFEEHNMDIRYVEDVRVV